MAAEWPQSTLEHETEILTGFPFKSNEYALTGVKLLRGDNIAQGRIRWDDVKLWPVEKTAEVKRYQLEPYDVILAMDRPWIEAGLKYGVIYPQDLPALLVQRVARLRAGPRLDQRFLRYLIGSRQFTDHVLAVQTGSAVPHISKGQIEEFRFPLPPLPAQRGIADLLGSLDDKIEVNRRTSKMLEEMARAIYKGWFIQFEPVKAKAAGATEFRGMPQDVFDRLPNQFTQSEFGPVPAGWRYMPIGSLVQVVGGSTPNTKSREYWEGGEYPFCTPKDMSGLTSPVLLNTERQITQAGVDEISSGQLPRGTVVLSSRAPIGYLAVAETPVSVNQGIIAMTTQNIPNTYVFFWTEANMNIIKSRAGGSTFAEISKQHFRPIPALRPDDQTLTAFGELTGPLFDLITSNERESGLLAAIREALLPKLISGALPVPSEGAGDG
jgi:type I restriction enzyme S subunit